MREAPPITLTVTDHAVLRYQERVACITDDAARAALSSKAVRHAASIGAPFVKLCTGQRILLRGHTVITVLPIGQHIGNLSTERNPSNG